MTKPTGNRRGRPSNRIELPAESAAFLQGDNGARILKCCDDIRRVEKIDLLACPAAMIWLAALFNELEFRTLIEVTVMSHACAPEKSALVMKSQRVRRSIMLMARAYECVAARKASPPSSKGTHTSPFFRFAKIIIENSGCPILRSPDGPPRWTFERALALRYDPAQRRFEELALFNALHASHPKR